MLWAVLSSLIRWWAPAAFFLQGPDLYISESFRRNFVESDNHVLWTERTPWYLASQIEKITSVKVSMGGQMELGGVLDFMPFFFLYCFSRSIQLSTVAIQFRNFLVDLLYQKWVHFFSGADSPFWSCLQRQPASYCCSNQTHLPVSLCIYCCFPVLPHVDGRYWLSIRWKIRSSPKDRKAHCAGAAVPWFRDRAS